MLIVISGFTCIYKWIFLIIIFNLSSFFREKRGKECSALLSLAKKTNLLDFNIKIGTQPSLSWFDQSLVISCLKYYVCSLTPGKDQLTPGKSGTFFFLFLDYVCLLCILIIFGVRTLIFFPLCCFVLFCFFVFVLFFLLCFCCCFFVFFCFQF